MQIKHLAATFGRLENETLDLEPGLNVIEAPNEAGKSTWTAFLRVMFYGLNTRDRSPHADKRRYLPWSGSPMTGRLELSAPQGEITLTRRTARANAPMGAFSAVYTGSSQPVEGLTAADCGETLLGVPQEVYERSAFIRQTGLAVDQSAALERRIASLITTGEEDTSFTDAAERLKRQLNLRRHNKTGLIPQTDREIQELRATLAELDDLTASVDRDLALQQAVQERMDQLEALLARHDAADRAEAALAVEGLRLDAASARDKVKTLESTSRGLPTRQELDALQGRIDALATVDITVAKARAQVETAARPLRRAESDLEAHPLAGLTPAQAANRPLDLPPRPKRRILPLCLAVLAGLVLGGVVGWFTRIWPLAVGAGLGLAGLLLMLATWPVLRRQRQWELDRVEREQRRRDEVAEYTALYDAVSAASAVYQNAMAAYEAVSASAKTNLEQILSQIRAFRPLIRDLPAARQALDAAYALRSQLDQARKQEETARLRWEARRDEAPPVPPVPVERPDRSREQLRLELAQAGQERAAIGQRIHTTQGRIQALGDPPELQLQLAQLEERRAQLEAEYDAVSLAMEVLFVANSSLQTRFSPDLGQRAAGIFTKLTKGRYNKVLLDRELTPSAQEAGQIIPREAALLSQGAADQLYLAVRLAICDMVLPQSAAAPLLLDDALVNFDDERMAAALDYLMELSQRRQILLFTCQHRETDYLRWAYPDRCHLICKTLERTQ